MSDDVLRKAMKTFLSTPQRQYNICWQGGEPTLMGLDFYQRAVDYQMRYGARGSLVANALQTNATLLDDEWGRFLNKYHFLVGVSLDGTMEMHNHFRRTASGEGSHQKVLAGIELLKRHRVECNLLALINSFNVTQPLKLYRYLKKLNIPHIQFTPCVEFDKEGRLLPYAITGEQWGTFLNTVFDEWHSKDLGLFSIRNFDAILEHLIYGKCSMCTMGTNCSQYFVLEHNGDIYPCDFFVEDRHRLGNIMEDSWEELLAKKEFLDFGKRKQAWSPDCNACEYVKICNGDCPKNRFQISENPENKSWLCDGWKKFYSHSFPQMKQISQNIIP